MGEERMQHDDGEELSISADRMEREKREAATPKEAT